jgi:excisionase family DNA binding protein
VSDKSPSDAPAAGYTVTEAADAIGLSGITVLRRVSSGTWPGGRVGRKWLVSRAFIDALAEAITTRPQVNAETFAAEWMGRSGAPATAGAVA